MSYRCQKLATDGITCVEWVEYTPILEALAISKQDAYALTTAICILMVTGFVFGLMGKQMLKGSMS